ncbi:MAG: hypothetical protein M0R51_06345 [Clostridia bacterium]|jgi:hypothetical protein|nr:hypothetical protein [Clostridia bacterium]
MLQTVALCSVSEYRKEGKEKDVNGNQNLFLTPLNGEIPNKCMVIAGTIAEGLGISSGNTYLFKFTEKKEKDDVYGRQFNTSIIARPSCMDVIEASIGKVGKVIVVKDEENDKVDSEIEKLKSANSEF